MRYLFVGGGTAGHIAPLVAVAHAVKQAEPTADLHYAGTQQDVDGVTVQEAGEVWQTHVVPAGKLHRHLTKDHLQQAKQVLAGMRVAKRLIHELQPDVVFCKGGYVTVPVALAAKRAGIRVVSHETDTVAGLANRMVARVASVVCTAWPSDVVRGLPREKLAYTGQPVRDAFYESSDELSAIDVSSGESPLVVTGGSQGAARLNELIAANWAGYLRMGHLVHVCGQTQLASLQAQAQQLPADLAGKLHLIGFTEEMPALLKRAWLVVSRAGGTTHELAATGTASILVPLSTAAQQHQLSNAQYLAGQGAALYIDETKPDAAEHLFGLVQGLAQNEGDRLRLASHMADLAKPDAAQTIARVLLHVARA